jgi:hypothetical protein
MPRRVATAVLLAVIASYAPAAHASTAPALAGENVVTADRSAKMRVVLPTQVKIPIDISKAVSISGSGRLVGLVLRENRKDAPDEAMFLRMPAQAGGRVVGWGPAVQVAGCTTPVPQPLPPVYSDCTHAKFPDHFTMHRGTYTLYVLADGAPVTVTLHTNLGGTAALSPSLPVGSGETAFTTSVDTPVLWSGGAAVRPRGEADLFTVAWWEQDASEYAEEGACWYDTDGIEALGEHRYVPGCPGGSSVAMGEVVNPMYGPMWTAKAGKHAMLGTSSTAGGTNGLGAYTTAQNVRGAGGLSVWLGR